MLVENREDVTIRNGAIQNFNTAILIRDNSHGARVRHMVLRGPEGFGMQVNASDNVEVKYSRIRNFRNSGFLVIFANNFVLRNSRILNVGTGSGEDCGGGVGIETFLSNGVKIKRNLFKRISRSGILHTAGPNARISGNTVFKTSSRPCRQDFGAITIVAGSRSTQVAYNYILRNDDFGIGLRQDVEDILIRHNKLWRNASGILFSLRATGTRITGNCISHSRTGIGLEIDPSESQSFFYEVDARHNYWGSRSGPSGDGPLGTILSGRGEEIIQKEIDNVKVVPFKRRCH